MSWYEVLTVVHVVAAAIGVGAAAASDSVFLSAIRNRHVGRDQFVLIKASSKVVMAGLTLLVLTGVGLLLHDLGLVDRPHFQAKMTAIIVLMINGFVFHGRLVPFLGEHRHTRLPEDAIASRLWLFAITGAVSAVSWFAALIIAAVGDIGASYWTFAGIYAGVIVLGSVAGYLLLSHLIFWSEKDDSEIHEQAVAANRVTLVAMSVLLVLLLGSLAWAFTQGG
jgi:hypothetical protein